MLIRAAGIARLPRSLLDPKLFPHTAYDIDSRDTREKDRKLRLPAKSNRRENEEIKRK